MKFLATTVLAAAAAFMSVASASSDLRGKTLSEVLFSDDDDFEDFPCVEIIFRDNTCQFDDDRRFSAAYLSARSECVCGGDGLDDFLDCQRCLLDHGFGREVRDLWRRIFAVIREIACDDDDRRLAIPGQDAPVPTAPTPSIITITVSDPNQVVPPATVSVSATGAGPSPSGLQKSSDEDAATVPTASPTSESTVSNDLLHESPVVDVAHDRSAAVSSFSRSGMALVFAGGIILGLL
ncbi:hypothetical protein BBK36DRAFT_1156297 [Trichoderma citrinoviride]|uniref:Uncharacterized protein n=1 Tax=Trichoderma citrinoviride TaxID=58853 RepID=A0A2T4BK98_9HYPO|nr:hypothetical protein BBK36DRAFT_1156297 [Trichoderma citrinoviride]PTB69732.1 hypothetical protein BBK36DRAFT_1156297 [Trichoderma citrinoviride]